MDDVEFYLDEAGEWRWRRKSENGEIVSSSGEGYVNYQDCRGQAFEQFGETVEYVFVEGVEDPTDG